MKIGPRATEILIAAGFRDLTGHGLVFHRTILGGTFVRYYFPGIVTTGYSPGGESVVDDIPWVDGTEGFLSVQAVVNAKKAALLVHRLDDEAA